MKLPCAFVLALTLAYTAHAQAPKPEDSAQAAAESWLALVDAGSYAESWTAAAPSIQKLVPQERWNKAMAAVRDSLGKMVARKLKGAKYTRTVPGAPDGEYVILQYDTTFEKKKAAVETVTPVKSAEGTWKVSGYYVK